MKIFLTGIIAGLAIGYLTAPRSGKESRSQLSRAIDEQTKGVKSQWNKAMAQEKETVENLKSQANNLANKDVGQIEQAVKT
ncbi:YtxH domain-containing protein [Larkinella terrae]|uniref:YtxH domain-containing protein n=1 Tax=Larkinella terrae TaxID=2025311 RepID=A0A7K0EII9_9BACT|nr:YtxH domain-containing protein [Larkinella terrae]MRS61659.1 YtxH domain-containing protein [Larkinella terrae]